MDVSRDQLQDLYVNQGLSVRACAQILGMPTHSGVSWLMKKYGIQARPSKFQKGSQVNKGRASEECAGWKGGKQTVPCDACGANLERFPSQIRARNFCNQECRSKFRTYDMTGKKVGLLTFVRKSGRDKHNHILWECICDCGGTKLVTVSDVSTGVKSCGCLLTRKGEDHPSWRGGKVIVACAYCGSKKSTYNSKAAPSGKHFCNSGCWGKYVSAEGTRRGENSPKWVPRVITQCAWCDEPLEVPAWRNKEKYGRNFCGVGCRREWRSANSLGSDNPNWLGGKSFEPYCHVWTDREFKQDIMERDGFECRNPDCRKGDSNLVIHHLDYDKKNCHPSNLITLCNSCNARANFHREFWQSFYRLLQYYQLERN